MSRKLSGNRRLLHLTVQMGIRFIKMGINNYKNCKDIFNGNKEQFQWEYRLNEEGKNIYQGK